MKNLVWVILLGIVCGCSSHNSFTDEPDKGRTESGDSVAITDSVDSTEVEIEPEPLTAELRPVLTGGKKWIMIRKPSKTEESRGCGRVSESGITCELIGDTLAYGKDCKIIRLAESDYVKSYVWYEENGSLYDVNYLFEEDGADKYEKGLTLAYSFYPEENDNPDRFIVLSKGTIVCCGKTRRAIKIYKSFVPGDTEYWIEGIGPVYGTCLEIPLYYTCGMNRYYELQQCYEGDELIFDIKTFKPETYKEEVRFIENYDKWFNL